MMLSELLLQFAALSSVVTHAASELKNKAVFGGSKVRQDYAVENAILGEYG